MLHARIRRPNGSRVPLRRAWPFLALLSFLLATGCGAPPSTFVHPDYDFAFVERVAVIPFENLTEDRGAGARMTRHFVNELLAAGAFDVVEPGEVTEALNTVGTLRTAELTASEIRQLGQELRTQALFLGSVTESSVRRNGSNSEAVVTLDCRLVETETAQVIWSTSVTVSGRGFWNGLFGTSGRSMGQVSREAARRAVARLLD